MAFFNWVSSSSTSKSLLVVAYANGIYPIILKNVTLRKREIEVVSLANDRTDYDDYTDRNCCAAYSPLANVALIISSTGTVKVANCTLGSRKWNVDKMLNEKLDGAQPWLDCSLAISNDGLLGLALDRRGKLVIVKFTMQ